MHLIAFKKNIQNRADAPRVNEYGEPLKSQFANPFNAIALLIKSPQNVKPI